MKFPGHVSLSLPYASRQPGFAQAVNAAPVNAVTIATSKDRQGQRKTSKTQVPAYFRDYATCAGAASDNLLVWPPWAASCSKGDVVQDFLRGHA